ncbi:MAG TPA: hypothetical protein VN578_01995 [Candidatus Binatia bacterium]|nr:hypothetical protein [Candidatus Binatia bacterium]
MLITFHASLVELGVLCVFGRHCRRDQGLSGPLAMLVAGPSKRHLEANHRLELLRLQ